MSEETSSEPVVTTKKVRVTPKVAADLLGLMRENRPLSNTTVKKYRDEMLEGEWRPYTDPIKFNTQGHLIDGQHRLWAVIESETTQDFIAIYNLPDDSFLYLDRGKRRGFADTLAITHPEVKNHLSVAALIGVAYQWDDGFRGMSLTKATASSHVPHRLLVETFEKNTDMILEADRWARNLNARFPKSLVPRSLGLGVYAMLKVDFDEAQEFLRGIADGDDLPAGSPISAFRNVLIAEMQRQVKNPWGVFRRFLKAWNLWRRGESTGTIITFKEGGSFPEAFPEPQ